MVPGFQPRRSVEPRTETSKADCRLESVVTTTRVEGALRTRTTAEPLTSIDAKPLASRSTASTSPFPARPNAQEALTAAMARKNNLFM